MRTNEQRADRAFRAVLAYGIEGDEEEAVTDLLTDLRHMSDQYGWTLDELVERSMRHYEYERQEQDEYERGEQD